MEIFVVPVQWVEKNAALRNIRHQVFVLEQNVSAEEEFDGEDASCEHFIALNEAGQELGCARLHPKGKIERMAVLEHARGLGIGRQLLDAAVASAKAQGFTSIYLHAQTHAEAFYRKGGFLPEGPNFSEAGIEHIRMQLALPIPFQANSVPSAPQDRTPSAREHRLPSSVPSASESATPAIGASAFGDEQTAIDLLIRCLQQPRRTLQIYSQELDPILFDTQECVDEISRFVRQSPGNRVRILIHTSKLIVSRGHQLIELARRLDSKFDVRLVPEELATEERCFISWDQQGYWVQSNIQEYQGLANDADSVLAKRLQERFDELWQRSKSDPELRVLGL